MEIFYYRTKEGDIPVRDYFADRYGIREGDEVGAQHDKEKKFVKINMVIKMAAEQRGFAGGEFSSPLAGYDFQELRIKEGDDLVRILYVAYHGEKLVLLSAYDKPNRYEKAKKRKVDRKIESMHRQVQIYYEDFLSNPTNYEKHET